MSSMPGSSTASPRASTTAAASSTSLDPYCSATKIRWLLEQDAQLRSRATGGHVNAAVVDRVRAEEVRHAAHGVGGGWIRPNALSRD